MIEHLSEQRKGMVFLLWGKHAQVRADMDMILDMHHAAETHAYALHTLCRCARRHLHLHHAHVPVLAAALQCFLSKQSCLMPDAYAGAADFSIHRVSKLIL